LLPYLRDKKNYTVDRTRLLSRTVERLDSVINREFPKTLSDVDSIIKSGVKRSINKSVGSQVESLKKKKLYIMSKEDVALLKEEALLSLNREFPQGSGVTYDRRLSAIGDHHKKQLSSLIRSSHSEDAVKRISSEVRSALSPIGAGQTAVAGGNLAKKLMRVASAEELRVVHGVEKDLFRKSNVSFAYWRLSPEHKWEGGKEICEVLASQESSDVVNFLRYEDTTRLTEGLYFVDGLPDYPHPYCKCFTEAAF
jgi:hypothetical protein